MEKRFARIEDGNVLQVFTYYDPVPDFTVPGLTDISDHAQRPRSGWTYDAQTDTFTEPPEPEE